ncbi:hypothetical protein QCA50_008857 [Cerrena zonata]|uniref:non-specific serine/threonine protein kinase n=1 Tax=Cerrena zonata TaxID=2478898 RepID=A0AAW0GCI9_9APHY
MSLRWSKRRDRLFNLLGYDSKGSEEEVALALDRILHGQSVIGRTSKTAQIDDLRFSDKDLNVVGTLEYGQFGVIDVVSCKLNGRVYVRKTIEKRFALKTRDQCSPQNERNILLRALKSQTKWAPHLLCAYQTATHLNLVMDYAEGGTLWDVLESSPLDGKVSEADIQWWAPQAISAIDWCHSQGFVHRDIKPHNFVLTSNAHVLLIDFGSAAPLLPPNSDGSQQIAKVHCQAPCGTCDYISPEILQAHEEALVALEMSEDNLQPQDDSVGGYGRETDWWSLGAMLYEMAYGVAPFFASDIRQTYAKITDHARSLRFKNNISLSSSFKDFLRRLLTTAELRLGRCSIDEIRFHAFFEGTNWSNLHDQSTPTDLHLPQFTYSTPIAPDATNQPSHSLAFTQMSDQSDSRAFAFSALFVSSPASAQGGSLLQATPLRTPSQGSSRSILRDHTTATSFIGFSWGPTRDAFGSAGDQQDSSPANHQLFTPRPLGHATSLSPFSTLQERNPQSTPAGAQRYPFATPVRPSAFTPYGTLPRASTIRRTAPRRTVSDREAMKQLVDCIGMSARKKVLESGRKPKALIKLPNSRSSTLKELRFDKSVMVLNDAGISYKIDSGSASVSDTTGVSLSKLEYSASSRSFSAQSLPEATYSLLTESDSSLDSDIPPSPSPSPRPGSAMSVLSRRSQTPTTAYFLRVGSNSSRSVDSKVFHSPLIPADPQWGTAPPRTTDAGVNENSKSQMANEDLSYDMLDAFEKRHSRLMDDIGLLRGRLDRVSGRLRRS